MIATKSTRVVFVVCHPDDEALWAGGLISCLAGIKSFDVHVICISGANDPSPRKIEFGKAQKICGYFSGTVVGDTLGPASNPIKSLRDKISDGLHDLKITCSDIDLLFTHSPYGDEHAHPHHIQACEELYAWAKKHKVPFGFFSCVPLPNSYLKPELRNMKRLGSLQLLNYAMCKYSLTRKLFRWIEKRPWRYPILYTQWLVDGKAKERMLNCYNSVGLDQHMKGYAMFTSNVESLYVFDQRGVDVIKDLIQLMETPGSEDLFPGVWTDLGIKSKIINGLCK